MTYTGDVNVGGPPDVRELASLTITKVAVDDDMANNAYLVRCHATGDQILIDAAAAPETLISLIGSGGLTSVITTHQHWDHHRALADVVKATGAQVIAGTPDAGAITEQTGVEVSRRVEHGETITVGRCELEVIALAGHTPGSIALLYDDPAADGHPHLFTGDSLFPGGVGNTFGDTDAFVQLIDEVESKVFGRLPDDTWFYPGHGGDSIIGTERPSVGAWRERGW